MSVTEAYNKIEEDLQKYFIELAHEYMSHLNKKMQAEIIENLYLEQLETDTLEKIKLVLEEAKEKVREEVARVVEKKAANDNYEFVIP